MKRILMALMMVALLAPFNSVEAMKIGVVDMAKVLFYFDEVKILRIEISNREARYQTELNQQEKEIQSLKKRLDSGNIPENEIQRVEKDLSRKVFNLQRKFEEYKKKLDEQKEEELERIKESVFKEIGKFARKKRLDMVIEKRQVYFGSYLDLTEELIDYLNKKGTSGNK